MHFMQENERVTAQAAALKAEDIDTFFENVIASGLSSYRYLQNVYTTKNVNEQGLSLALCLCERFLKDKNAVWRVHGGGFAGTVQAFVPCKYTSEFKEYMEKVFGEGHCYVLSVRRAGAFKII